ncbi:hypothetical protein QAD02_007775 [Eretmocerus hayati]|uniref:Uncharacterized protein n=1 Tax=Eretmocerus hayati TaxID=131215 RepID=A0ACC2N4M5_9HYME|nr:hypothetical protein QAD02_007775 [Eretmocerus hayati]
MANVRTRDEKIIEMYKAHPFNYDTTLTASVEERNKFEDKLRKLVITLHRDPSDKGVWSISNVRNRWKKIRDTVNVANELLKMGARITPFQQALYDECQFLVPHLRKEKEQRKETSKRSNEFAKCTSQSTQCAPERVSPLQERSLSRMNAHMSVNKVTSARIPQPSVDLTSDDGVKKSERSIDLTLDDDSKSVNLSLYASPNLDSDECGSFLNDEDTRMQDLTNGFSILSPDDTDKMKKVMLEVVQESIVIEDGGKNFHVMRNVKFETPLRVSHEERIFEIPGKDREDLRKAKRWFASSFNF